MVIEFYDLTIVNVCVLGVATLSLKMKLISPEITTWIETQHEQPILTDVHKIEKSILHVSYTCKRPYFENVFSDTCFSCLNLSYKRPLFVVTKYYQNLIGRKTKEQSCTLTFSMLSLHTKDTINSKQHKSVYNSLCALLAGSTVFGFMLLAL